MQFRDGRFNRVARTAVTVNSDAQWVKTAKPFMCPGKVKVAIHFHEGSIAMC
jgi:hypothetical protein